MPQATKHDTGDDARELSGGAMSGKLASVGTNIASVDEVKELLFATLGLRKDKCNYSQGMVSGYFDPKPNPHRPYCIT